uniref:Uncharacterized protein n=1 Tax=Trypanosoma vivax (strain Y486) TaxID=1055687 RepID=G0TT08_TRYVY|nr:hypothetical protein TVY486_0302760 [Trypanosoma vivax Y486]
MLVRQTERCILFMCISTVFASLTFASVVATSAVKYHVLVEHGNSFATLGHGKPISCVLSATRHCRRFPHRSSRPLPILRWTSRPIFSSTPYELLCCMSSFRRGASSTWGSVSLPLWDYFPPSFFFFFVESPTVALLRHVIPRDGWAAPVVGSAFTTRTNFLFPLIPFF